MPARIGSKRHLPQETPGQETCQGNLPPLPIVDELTTDTYIVLSVQFIPDPDEGGFTARIPGIAAYGEGETEQEASLALCEALRGYLADS